MELKRAIEHGALAILAAVGLAAALVTISVAHRETGASPPETGARPPATTIVMAGGADRAVAAPLPYGADLSAEPSLASVACPAPLTCVATGYYVDNSGNAQGLLVTADGALWDSQTAPLPRDAGPAPNAQFGAGSLACPSPAECVAVGSYETPASHNPHSMLVTGSAAKWTATATPLPGDADPVQGSQLGAVACPAPSACVAVGSYTDAAGTGHGLLVTGSGTAWAAIRAPLPAGAPPGQSVSISSVACASATSCVAVGTSTDKTGNARGFVLSGSGKSWTAARAPLPDGAAPAGTSGRTISLGPIACPAPSKCVALGSYTDQAGYLRGMLLTGAGARWAARTAPVPPGAYAPYGTTASSIACPSATRCVIAGGYTDAYEYPHGMLITGSATTWTAAAAPLPAGGNANDPSIVTDIACPSTGACVAAGAYTDRHGYAQTMLMTGSATSWIPAEVLMPAGTQEEKTNQGPNGAMASSIQAAACFGTGECLAVGGQALLIEPLPGPHPWPDIYLTTAFTVGLYTYPGFPAAIGVDNHTYISGISWKSVTADTAEATGTLATDNCTPDCASGKYVSYPIKLIASSPRQCVVSTQLTPPLAVREYVFSKISIAGQVPGVPAYLVGPKLLSLNCVAS